MDTWRESSGPRKIVAIALVVVLCAALGLAVYRMTRDDIVLERNPTGSPADAGGQDATAVVKMDEGTIHVTTMGSSSCPAVPVDVAVVDGGVVVTVDTGSAELCTADYGPTTSVVAIPDELKDADVVPTVTIERT